MESNSARSSENTLDQPLLSGAIIDRVPARTLSRRQRIMARWAQSNDKLRWLSDAVAGGPLGTALNSSILTTRIEQFMRGYPNEYDNFKKVFPYVTMSVIVITGTAGTYFVCCDGKKRVMIYKAALHGVRTFAFLSMLIQEMYNNSQTPDADGNTYLNDKIFFTTIFAVSAAAGAIKAYRFKIANSDSLKSIRNLDCKSRFWLVTDIFTRALVDGSIAVIGLSIASDYGLNPQHNYTIAGSLGLITSLAQSLFYDPADGPDTPIIELGALVLLIIDLIEQFMLNNNINFIIPEAIIWAILTATTILIVSQKWQGHYPDDINENGNEADEDMTALNPELVALRSQISLDVLPSTQSVSPKNSYAGETSHGHFATDRAMFKPASDQHENLTVLKVDRKSESSF